MQKIISVIFMVLLGLGFISCSPSSDVKPLDKATVQKEVTQQITADNVSQEADKLLKEIQSDQ